MLRRNHLLKHVTEGRIQEARRRRRRKQLDDLQEKRGYRKLEQEALEEATELSQGRQCEVRMCCWMDSTG